MLEAGEHEVETEGQLTPLIETDKAVVVLDCVCYQHAPESAEDSWWVATGDATDSDAGHANIAILLFCLFSIVLVHAPLHS
eukprot:scaffold395392_cov55-Attheya_sp.AAC.1